MADFDLSNRIREQISVKSSEFVTLSEQQRRMAMQAASGVLEANVQPTHSAKIQELGIYEN